MRYERVRSHDEGRSARLEGEAVYAEAGCFGSARNLFPYARMAALAFGVLIYHINHF